MTDPTIAYVSIAIPLGVAFGLSLAIERTIEWFSNIGDLFHGRYKDTQIPSANTADRALEEMLDKKRYDEERMQTENEMSSKVNLLITRIAIEKDDTKKLLLKKELSKLEAEHDYGEKHHGPIFLMQEATNPDEGRLLKHFLTHLFGFSMGILLAHFANLHLFGAMINALDKTMQIPGWLDNVFSGLLIGSGSAPIHFLIGFISVRKVTVPQGFDRSETTKVSPSNNVPSLSTVTPVVNQPSASPVITSVSTYSWKDITYTGGIDSMLLESIHKRPQKPDSIFYHHTAMASRSTFDDVVQTIKNRTDKNGKHWVTGYHCVILSDGSISPFCRWDRYGNQVSGYNATSLGIAFNGNFETDPKIPFSNPDGRFGSPFPTEIQVNSGARVVALWALLYDIPLDFSKSIRPHCVVSNKTCPGSNFTDEQFKNMVTGFCTHWKNTPSIMEKIAQYRLKPYTIDKNWS